MAERAAGWAREDHAAWAVCEPTTGEMLGEVELTGLDLGRGVAAVECWALPAGRGRGMTTAAAGAVARFAFGGLGLHRLTWRHAAGNVASARLAATLGFVPEGRLREAWPVDGRRDDVLVLGRLATDS